MYLAWPLRANLHVELGVFQRYPGRLDYTKLHPLGPQHSMRVHCLKHRSIGIAAAGTGTGTENTTRRRHGSTEERA